MDFSLFFTVELQIEATTLFEFSMLLTTKTLLTILETIESTWKRTNVKNSYRNQSTVNITAIISLGNPTVSRTINIVTKPACGIAAAPTEARIEVKLKEKSDFLC